MRLIIKNILLILWVSVLLAQATAEKKVDRGGGEAAPGSTATATEQVQQWR